MNARLHLSRETGSDASLFEAFLTQMLDTIVSKGDASETHSRQVRDTELAAQEEAERLESE